MNLPDPPVLAFDDITVDLPGRRLLRAGREQPLEPKAFAVLCLLARAPGQVFSRDEILDAVWGHRHVTPGVLNRIITLLRHALGEDAHHPRYLHTVHGYGYRFDRPPLRESAVDLAAALEAAGPAPDPPRRRASDGMPGAVAPSRSRWRWAAAASLLVVVGVIGWQLRDAALPPGPARPTVATAAPVLAVMPLQALGDDPRGQAFADGLSEELTGLLARIDGLRVISRTSSLHVREAGLPSAEIARRLQASHLLEGSVRQDGERLRIDLRLIEAGNGRAVWAQDFDRELRDIFVVQRNIAYAIAHALQLQLGLSPNTARPDEDPTLYRRYLLARYGQREKRAPLDLIDVERELRDLVREHPGYARAWGGLAAILSQRSRAPLPGRDALRAESEQAAARALQLDPGQSDAIAVLADQACRQQQWERCMALSRRSIALAPSDPMCRGAHAFRLATMGYLEQAQREMDAVLAIAPFDPIVHFWRGRLLDTLGRHDEARRHLALADPQQAATGLFFNAIWRRDYDEAHRLASALPADMPWRASELAAVTALRDPSRWPAVVPAIEAAERNHLYGQVPYDFTRLLLPRRDHARDITGLDAVQRAGYASYQWVFWQPESAALRRDPAFAQYLQRSGLLAYWRANGWPAQCRPEGDGARCE